jgi:serine/threonine-protein kinase
VPEPTDTPSSRASASAVRSETLPRTIGRYEVVRQVGEGAMGRVLLAHDPVLDRDVAVKHLRDDLRIPRDVRDGLLVRMRHEARAAARVAHPNLVTLHDMGEDPGVGLYLVFEYVRGPTLKERLRDGPLPPDEVAGLACQLGEALTCAHEAGVVHRDVKPENVMLARTGAKIADFGIARVPDSTLTHVGGLLGTPAYSAPETFRASTFSPRSDQFSLAASLYEALSGARAFPGDDSVTVTSKIANDPPEPVAAALGLAGVVDDVLARAMAKQPEARFPSCEAFGRALAAALGEPHPVVAAPKRSSVPARARERTTGQVLLGAAVVVATAALILRTASRPTSSDGDDTAAPSPSAAASTSSSASSSTKRPPALLGPAPRAKPRALGAEPPADRAPPAASASAPQRPEAPDAAAPGGSSSPAGVGPASAPPQAGGPPP